MTAAAAAPNREAAAPPRAGRLAAELFRRPSSALGAVIVLAFLALTLLAPLLAPYGPSEQIAGAARQPPSAAHWFGADRLGRDVFSRVLYGGREVLGLAGLGTLLAVAAGAAVGLTAAYRGGWVEEVVFRLLDSLLAMPALLLALLLLGVVGPSQRSVLIVIVVVYTPIVARVVRSVVLAVKTKGFVEAARIQGEPTGYILWREIFPSVLPAQPQLGADGQRGAQLHLAYTVGALLPCRGHLAAGHRHEPAGRRAEARAPGRLRVLNFAASLALDFFVRLPLEEFNFLWT